MNLLDYLQFYKGKTKYVTEIVYKGKGLSLNTFYSQGHWKVRLGYKNKYKKIFVELINNNKELRPMEQYILLIIYNSRHDPDNVIGMEKVFNDVLKEGYIPDDSKHQCKGLMVVPDLTLPMDTFKFILFEYGN